MKDEQTNILSLKRQVQEFCETRDWDQFHNAKELSIGAITEASELLEHFRFLTPEQIEEKMNNEETRKEVGEELADVFFFLLRFSQRYNFDLADCFAKKMEKNNRKYPAEEFTGKNHKSTWVPGT